MMDRNKLKVALVLAAGVMSAVVSMGALLLVDHEVSGDDVALSMAVGVLTAVVCWMALR